MYYFFCDIYQNQNRELAAADEKWYPVTAVLCRVFE